MIKNPPPYIAEKQRDKRISINAILCDDIYLLDASVVTKEIEPNYDHFKKK